MCDLASKSKNYHDSDHFSICFSRMRELNLQQKFSDATLVIKNQRIKVHKIILAGCSDYFKVLFFTNKNEYDIDGVDVTTVQHILEFCYTGKIDINNRNVFDLLNAASLFLMQSVINACFKFLQKIINDDNCLDILNVAQLHSVECLESYAFDYVQNRFKEVSMKDKFLKLELEQLKKILKNDYLNVSSEDEVFKCIQRWMKHDEKSRGQYTASLIECVRLPFLTTEFIFGEVQPFCGTSPKCGNMIVEILRWKLLPNSNNLLDPSQLKPRSVKNTIILIGGSRWGVARQGIIEIYNPIKNQWSDYLDTKITKTYMNAVVVKDSVIVIGGYIGDVVVNTVESVDVKTGKKTSLSPMLLPRSHTEAVYSRGFIYVPGGKSVGWTNILVDNGTPPLSSMEQYNVEEDKWEYSADLITPRECHGVTLLGNEIFIVGGWSTEKALNSTEAFCPATGKWRSCGSMIVARCFPGIASVNGYLYAIGGRKLVHKLEPAYSSLERYNPKTDTWSIIAEFKGPRYAQSAGALGNKLIVMGGAGPSIGIQVDVDEFDPENRTWKKLSNILGTRELAIVLSVPISWIK